MLRQRPLKILCLVPTESLQCDGIQRKKCLLGKELVVIPFTLFSTIQEAVLGKEKELDNQVSHSFIRDQI